ncbi:Inner membrane protein translocase component YidC, OxaA protein [Pediococcus damnosus]|uniref:membrane protein insertase YidC n=1 Tax=Pediococcus damnosus TaxID=51663 RepID=UPI00078C0FEF|nr:membrane protein insertase YidC [Pediococcus damnosus]AMV61370.1 Inner membrane protein translocase component YidC, OxaA protein [Pediococcus damnosus]
MKKMKHLGTLTAIAGLALLLTGCVQRTKAGKPYGAIYDYLAVPTQHVMSWLTGMLGGSYGWAIIAVTFIVRMILLPMMINQSRKATVQQEKMAFVKPQMTAIQERQQNATTNEEKAAASQQMMSLYRDNGISMTGGIGCLPILIQLPVFAALYAAIQYSPALSSGAHGSMFMGVSLGKPSIFLAALSFLVYLLQGWLGTLGIPAEQKKSMMSMMIVSPLMIFFVSFRAPAGLGLYFFVGGIFACIQTLIIYFYRPRIRASVAEEMKKNPPKVVVPPIKPAEPKTTVTQTQRHHDNRQRNAGKQQHHSD